MEKVDFAYLKAKSKTNGDVFIKAKTLLTQDRTVDKSDMMAKNKNIDQRIWIKLKDKKQNKRENQIRKVQYK